MFINKSSYLLLLKIKLFFGVILYVLLVEFVSVACLFENKYTLDLTYIHFKFVIH